MKNKFVCIHGHFYQPPRENPWLNEVEEQYSAYPYHDWNERINAECYARNSASRILNQEGHITDIVNNYAYISYNFGPTLLDWLEKKSPDIYRSILEADEISRKQFNGHGSAMAQTYNHLIMPLANEQDKHTQVIWGIYDFESRFGRKPRGMWCSETAIDVPTLEVLTEHGIEFTILSPYQAKAVRKLKKDKAKPERPDDKPSSETVKAREWEEVSGGRVDPRRPYICKLPSGRSITLFFYDGPISQGIAFEGLLNNGQLFAERLVGHFDNDDSPQLMHIATDGESYGHHHRYGEMALSYCLHTVNNNEDVSLTVYSQFMDLVPAEYEVQVEEPSAWSCPFGVERWNSDCGVNTGGNPGWHQKWRAPLRMAFDWIRDTVAPVYEKQVSELAGTDPWTLRNDYISIIRDRSEENVHAFIRKHQGHELSDEERVRLLKLLEMQYHCMLMYTSCGWFFDEVTGIETLQDIAYGARAVQLLEELTGHTYEDTYVGMLAKAPSNLPEYGNAAKAYDEIVRPSKLDLKRVAAHYAMASLFAEGPNEVDLYSYEARSRNFRLFKLGKYRLCIGRVQLRSTITTESSELSYAMLHLGDHQLLGGVRRFEGDEAYDAMFEDISQCFERVNIYEISNLMDKHFGSHSYSIWHLFRDEQRRVMNNLAALTTEDVQSNFRKIYNNHYPMMVAMRELRIELPEHLRVPLQVYFNQQLTSLLHEKRPDMNELDQIMKEAERFKLNIDLVKLAFLMTKRVDEVAVQLESDPMQQAHIQKLVHLLKLTHRVGLDLELWKIQNICYMIYRRYYSHCLNARISGNEPGLASWCDAFDELFDLVGMSNIVDELPVQESEASTNL
ncbi:DUF3536 domain-containing protein [Roseivirga sp. BDSF3-8]|uniref:DUF3536 domain-containing protein n=1 Tax=Roseivirga sp. BDSF3-8 TaxID=3241598 RepID=UPI003531C49E